MQNKEFSIGKLKEAEFAKLFSVSTPSFAPCSLFIFAVTIGLYKTLKKTLILIFVTLKINMWFYIL